MALRPPTPTRRRVPGAQHRLLPLLPPVGAVGWDKAQRLPQSPPEPPPPQQVSADA